MIDNIIKRLNSCKKRLLEDGANIEYISVDISYCIRLLKQYSMKKQRCKAERAKR